MKIVNNIIYFKSMPKYYDREISGMKANTVRIVDKFEDALIQLSELDYIGITNTETEDFFMRKLSDITRYVYNNQIIIYIFSWRSYYE